MFVFMLMCMWWQCKQNNQKKNTKIKTPPKKCGKISLKQTDKQTECVVGSDVSLWWIDVVPAEESAVWAKGTLASHNHNKDWNKSSGGMETYQPNFSLQSEISWDVDVLQHKSRHSINWTAEGATVPSFERPYWKTRTVCVCVCGGLKGGLHWDNTALKTGATWAPRGPCLCTEVKPIWDHIWVTQHEGVR